MIREVGAIVFFALGAYGCVRPNNALLKRVADVPVPGKATRFDYQSLDPTTGRLYLSHLGDGTVVVLDTRNDEVVANIDGFPHVTGVLVVPSLKRLYASAAGAHQIVVLDTDSLKILKRIDGGKYPDGLAWSPETHKLFVSDEAGKVEIVVDTNTNERVDTIEMGGEVGNTQYDPGSHLIYACVQTRDELVSIDPATDTIVARYPMKGGSHPHGLYIDDAHRRAYVACEGNNRLLVFNLATHVVEDALPVGWVPDVLAFDRTLNRLYVAAEMGPVSVFRYDETESRLVSLGQTDVGGNAHSVSVDSATHRVYFPLKSGPLIRIMLPADETESHGKSKAAENGK